MSVRTDASTANTVGQRCALTKRGNAVPLQVSSKSSGLVAPQPKR
jgi:hypothetical protein